MAVVASDGFREQGRLTRSSFSSTTEAPAVTNERLYRADQIGLRDELAVNESRRTRKAESKSRAETPGARPIPDRVLAKIASGIHGIGTD
jgi:hypothetical protein